MALSKDKIEHIAHLAKINLLPAEKEKFFKEFSQILDFVGQLEKVETSGSTNFCLNNSVVNERDDKANKKSDQEIEKLMANVPAKSNCLVKVKKIFK